MFEWQEPELLERAGLMLGVQRQLTNASDEVLVGCLRESFIKSISERANLMVSKHGSRS